MTAHTHNQTTAPQYLGIGEKDGMVAPALDFADGIRLVTIERDAVTGSTFYPFSGPFIPLRVHQLVQWGVTVLICGGISHAFAVMLRYSDIQLLQGITGTVDSVTDAYLQGTLDNRCFCLPGRPRRRGRCRPARAQSGRQHRGRMKRWS